MRCLILICAGLLAAATASAELEPFAATYGVRIVVVRGESSVALHRAADGTYTYETITEPRGFLGAFVRGEIREASRFRIGDAGLVPLAYERVDTISEDERDLVIEFDHERAVAIRRYDETRDEVALDTPNMIDPGSLAIAVMLDLRAGREPGTYTLVERDELERVDVRYEGDEKLQTRAGEFHTRRFAHEAVDAGRITRLWAARELDWMMVQMAQFRGEKTRARLKLESYRR